MSLPIFGQLLTNSFCDQRSHKNSCLSGFPALLNYSSQMYSSYNKYNNKFSRKHELTTTSVDSRDLNPQDSDRRPSKASIVLGTVATEELNDIRPTTGHFNPRSKRYKLCCAHVKTCTIATGIVEIFVVCFLVVAVLPDLSSKLCSPSKDDIAIEQILENENITLEQNFQFGTANSTNATLFLSNLGLDTIQRVSCSVGIGWFFWAFLHIISVNVLFYGCKNNRWKLFIPHLIIRFSLIVIFISLVTLVVIVLFNPITGDSLKSPMIVFVLFASAFVLLLGFLTAVEVRCCEFVKRSAETGFSTTIARSIGAPTISLSDGRNNLTGQVASLPSPPPIVEAREEPVKVDEDSQPVTLPSPSPTPNNGATRRRSEAFSENPLHLRSLPPLRHTYRPG